MKTIFCIVFFCVCSIAAPLFPCPTAAASKNGNFMVVADNLPDGKAVFKVLRKENFINEKDRIISPQAFWTDSVTLTVVLDEPRAFSCPGVPLITNDGEFLVVLKTGPVFAGSVLRIYRRHDQRRDQDPYHGVLVKEISINDIWPEDKVSSMNVWTDHTPEWFAGGSFEFSADSQQLLHATRWGTTVRIDLRTGEVRNETSIVSPK